VHTPATAGTSPRMRKVPYWMSVRCEGNHYTSRARLEQATAHLRVDLPGIDGAGPVVGRRAQSEQPVVLIDVRGAALLPERAALAEPRLHVPVLVHDRERALRRHEVGLDGLALKRWTTQHESKEARAVTYPTVLLIIHIPAWAPTCRVRGRRTGLDGGGWGRARC
jgi:hypothetical protein